MKPGTRNSEPGTLKTALVTGAGTGIGRGIALALARRGYDLVLVGRREARLREVALVAERVGVCAVVLPADLSKSADLNGLVERARTLLGPIDLLVNNAGELVRGNLRALSYADIARSISTNLIAPIELTRQALPDLRARKGTVVFVGSTMSKVPMPSASIYSATKSGIKAAVESLRYELEPEGIHVLLAYPPPTDTAMTRGMGSAAGLSRFPRRNPDIVGEQIVRAIISGRKELMFGMDRSIGLLYHLVPGLVRAIFRSQRHRFAGMMGSTRKTSK